MRKLISLLALVLFFAASHVQAEEVKVTVKGMVCSFCVQGIDKTFKKLDSVQDIEVDMDKKLVTIKLNEGRSLSDEEITAKITDAGYNVEKIERSK